VTQTFLLNNSPVPEGTAGSALGEYAQTINQDIVQDFDQQIQQDIIQYDIPVFYPGDEYDYKADFYNITPEGNISVDDYVTDLGNNYRIVEVFADGYVLLEKDFVQQIDQDIIQDVFYEVDLVQDIIFDQDIVQEVLQDNIITETQTRLAD